MSLCLKLCGRICLIWFTSRKSRNFHLFSTATATAKRAAAWWHVTAVTDGTTCLVWVGLLTAAVGFVSAVLSANELCDILWNTLYVISQGTVFTVAFYHFYESVYCQYYVSGLRVQSKSQPSQLYFVSRWYCVVVSIVGYLHSTAKNC